MTDRIEIPTACMGFSCTPSSKKAYPGDNDRQTNKNGNTAVLGTYFSFPVVRRCRTTSYALFRLTIYCSIPKLLTHARSSTHTPLLLAVKLEVVQNRVRIFMFWAPNFKHGRKSQIWKLKRLKVCMAHHGNQSERRHLSFGIGHCYLPSDASERAPL